MPWLAAAVVAIIVITSFRAFQGEGSKPEPLLATTPIITEGPVRLSEARLPDGSVLMLPEGSAALELARALSAGEAAVSRGFRLDCSDEAVHAVASVLKGWPAVQVRIEGAAGQRVEERTYTRALLGLARA